MVDFGLEFVKPKSEEYFFRKKNMNYLLSANSWFSMWFILSFENRCEISHIVFIHDINDVNMTHTEILEITFT